MTYQTGPSRGLYRSDDHVFFGVCGGIAEHFDMPPWGVRLVWVLLTIMGLPFMVLGYLVLALVLKRQSAPPPVPSGPWAGGVSHGEALTRFQQRFGALDKRLQRLESIVTRPGFGLEEEYRRL